MILSGVGAAVNPSLVSSSRLQLQMLLIYKYFSYIYLSILIYYRLRSRINLLLLGVDIWQVELPGYPGRNFYLFQFNRPFKNAPRRRLFQIEPKPKWSDAPTQDPFQPPLRARKNPNYAARAKELSRYAEKTITLGKRAASESSRLKVFERVMRPETGTKVLTELRDRYVSRPGGIHVFSGQEGGRG